MYLDPIDDIDFFIMVFAFAACVAIFICGMTVVVDKPQHPTPAAVCRHHDGVRTVSGGYAICLDGTARRAS